MNDLDLGFTEDETRTPSRGQLRRRRKRERLRRRRARVAASVALLVVLVLIGGGVWGGYTVYQKVTEVPDYAGKGSGSVLVRIMEQESLSAVGQELEKKGVIKSQKAFVVAADDNPDSTDVQPGYYQLRKKMAASHALKRLLDPQAKVQWHVTVPEGLRAKRVMQLLAKRTEIPLAKYRAATKHPQALGLPAEAKGKIEGYLFPATYNFPPKSTATSVLRTMVERHKQEQTTVGLESAAKKRGISTHQAVTLASLLEAEARQHDYGRVSRVVYNRVEKGTRLQFDTTVNYALGRATLKVSKADTRVKSPYNTYLHKGLPPGPIDNPGAAALKSAVNPTPGNWLYFVTTNPKTGETKFTDSAKEFRQFKKEFKRNNR